MTRKDYVAIVAALKDCQPIGLSEIGRAQKLQHNFTVEALADVLAADNSRFDRSRFLAACGVQ